MERYKIQRLALRPDQASRLYEYGFKIRGLRGKTVYDDLHYEDPNYNSSPLFDVELPKTAIVVREPEPGLGGQPGIARVQPKDSEGYLREFRWRPAVREVPAKMTGFVRLDEFVRKPDKKKEDKDEDDAGASSLHA